jgi:transposase-like protein
MQNKKCYYCGRQATRFNETRVKQDGVHREIVDTCDVHYNKLIKENVQNRV